MAPRCQGGGGDLIQQHEHLRHCSHRMCWCVRCHGGYCLFPIPLQGLINNNYFLILNPLILNTLYFCQAQGQGQGQSQSQSQSQKSKVKSQN